MDNGTSNPSPSLNRDALMQPHTLEGMLTILNEFSADRNAFSDQYVHLRRGLAKDIIEEYAPLYQLACELKGFKSARLTIKSSPGPDAIVQLNDGSEIAIQITTAGETESTALQREVLSLGEPVFSNQHASRVLPSKKISVQGRVLSTKKENTERMIEEVKAAIRRKTSAYHPGTQCLLVLIRQSSLTMELNWTSQLVDASLNVALAAYSAVYVTNTENCTKCAGAAPVFDLVS